MNNTPTGSSLLSDLPALRGGPFYSLNKREFIRAQEQFSILAAKLERLG